MTQRHPQSAPPVLHNDLAIQNSATLIVADLRGHKLTIMGDLRQTSGTLNLNLGAMTVNGSYYQSGGTMNVNGGKLTISGSYYIVGKSSDISGGTYTYSDGVLKMVKAADEVRVGKDFVTASDGYDSNVSNLTNGTLYIGGNFRQIGTSPNSNTPNEYNFNASGDHKTVLDGKGNHTIRFESAYSHFATLELTQLLKRYTFSRTPCWQTLIESGEAENVFVLPANLHTIEVSAFEGNIALQVVEVSESAKLTSIQSGAFKNCANLLEITIPGTVTHIAEDAFEGCPNLTIIVLSDYAEEYAKSHGINYIIATK